MKNLIKALAIGGLTIVGLLLLVIYNQNAPNDELKGVTQGSEYKYTQLTGVVATSSTEIKTTAGTLGSIVITADAASGAIVVYDATSTEALSGPSALYSRIADLEDGLLEGVYTFDVSFYNGLVLDTDNWAGFAGDMTLTWR